MNDLERDLRQMFERREGDLREPRFAPVHAPAPLLRRTHRHQAGVVFAALAVVAALAIGSTAGVLTLLRSSERRVPANPTETPTSPDLGLVRRPDLGGPFTIRAASGVVDGEPWGIWASEDLRCLAFANVDGVHVNGLGSTRGGEAITAAGCDVGLNDGDLMDPRWGYVDGLVPGQQILYGLVSGRVARIGFAMDDGSTYLGTIHPASPEVTTDARLYTAVTDRRWGSFTGTLTAQGADGSVLGQTRYPSDADGPGGWSMPISVETMLASGIPVNEEEGRPSEPDRWEISVWRNGSGDWCLGTIFPNASQSFDRFVAWADPRLPSALVASEGRGCGPREALFQDIRSGAIGHADVWSIESQVLGSWDWSLAYRTFGTVSDDVAAVRLEIGDGQVVDATLHDPPPGFEDMGRLFVAEFRSKDEPKEGSGRSITWRAIALDASGEVLGADEMSP